ncbi:MAG: IS30 family transposase [Eggerthellaceae bacterium]|nr:IS30 family transposase [Eggerthellaceae bacterium]
MPEKKRGHLTAGDRMLIEECLAKSVPVAAIAKRIGVSPSTVEREIKRNSVPESPRFLMVKTQNLCVSKDACKVHGLCRNGCMVACAKCGESLCNGICPEFRPNLCRHLLKSPFVCNDCRRRYGSGCGMVQSFYDGLMADEIASARKAGSRAGIDCTEEDLAAMAAMVKPYLAKGQSPAAIWAAEGQRLPVSERTFYRYVSIGAFEDILNIDLPRKVRYKVRKKKGRGPSPRGYLDGRTYSDFAGLPIEEQMGAVEMDCVVSARGSDKAILTILFRRWSFQAMMLLERHDQAHVAASLDALENLIGTRAFRHCMGVMLTDRGSEFMDWASIERSARVKGRRCSVYYCDPMKSGQKGRCERNHVELRKILPKGTSFARLTPGMLAEACSNVNSYPRPALGGATPYRLASAVLPEALLDGLGIIEVPQSEVVMRPSLLDL